MTINMAEILMNQNGENHANVEKRAEQKLEELRRISNVIQALENLIVQCETADGFDGLKEFAESSLEKAQVEMRWRVHRV